MDLGQQLELLLGNFTHLESRLRHLSYDTTVCGERIEVRCSYVSFQAGVQTIDEFIDVLASHIVPFCLPRSAIKSAQDAFISGDHVAAGRIASEISEKAKALFIKAKKGSHRSGEAAEILLYILNEWVLKAPQIVSKMYLLSTMSRDEAKEKVILHGGTVTSSVSKNTGFVVVGESPGSKFDKAQKLGIKILSEEEFLEMIK